MIFLALGMASFTHTFGAPMLSSDFSDEVMENMAIEEQEQYLELDLETELRARILTSIAQRLRAQLPDYKQEKVNQKIITCYQSAIALRKGDSILTMGLRLELGCFLINTQHPIDGMSVLREILLTDVSSVYQSEQTPELLAGIHLQDPSETLTPQEWQAVVNQRFNTAMKNVLHEFEDIKDTAAGSLAAQVFRDAGISGLEELLDQFKEDAIVTKVVTASLVPKRKAAQEQMIDQWARRDPGPAADYVLTAADFSDQDRERVLTRVVTNWGRRDAAQAVSWVKGVKDPRTRTELFLQMIPVIASSKPEQAVALLAEVPAEQRGETVKSLAETWAELDTAAAMTWVTSLPEDDAKVEAVRCVGKKLFFGDPAKMTAWLDKMPAGRARDGAVAKYVDATFARDPEGALAWAATISNSQESSRIITSAAEKWLWIDKLPAARWIQQSTTLDAKTKARLLAEVKE